MVKDGDPNTRSPRGEELSSIAAASPRTAAAGEDEYMKYETVFTNAKAGMGGVDKEKVKRVVYEMSKDSAYFQNEQRKQEATRRRVEELRKQARQLTAGELAEHTRVADTQLAQLELSRTLHKIWLVVDMDAFYAAVEERDNPSLKDKAMAVGGTGMITTANYKAREFGVRSAMPGFIAKRLCPHLVFVRPDFSKYSRAAEETRAIFSEFDAEFEAGSLDEAYMDVTALAEERRMSGEQLAQELRERVLRETGLSCSVGIAPNKRLAKVCSDINKPNGQFVVAPTRSAVMAFMETLPIRKVGGIGRVAEESLREVLDVHTCGDLLQQRGSIVALFSSKSAGFYLQVALGLGSTEHSPAQVERTFHSISSRAEMELKVDELATHLAADMEKEDLKGRTLTLKLKTSEFRLYTRACSTPHWLVSAHDIKPVALRLLAAERERQEGLSLRLMGLRMSSLEKRHGAKVATDPGQATLSQFVTAEDGSKAADPCGQPPTTGTPPLSPATTPDVGATGGEGGRPNKVIRSSNSEWECRTCTLLNLGIHLRCAACESHRFHDPPEAQPSGELPVAPSSSITPVSGRAEGRAGERSGAASTSTSCSAHRDWECRICTLQNLGIHIRCAACDAHRSSTSIHDVCNSSLLPVTSPSGRTAQQQQQQQQHCTGVKRGRKGSGGGGQVGKRKGSDEGGGIRMWLKKF